MTMDWYREIEQALPPLRLEDYRNECDFYGATDEIARALGLEKAPVASATWAHGWRFDPLRFCEPYVWNRDRERRVTLVFRKAEEQFLREQGYGATFAVGAPLLYAEPAPMKRWPESLLIMPVHSMDYVHSEIEHEAYFAALDPYLAKFRHVAACLHPACMRRGSWGEEFRRRGIPYFAGAEIRDRNGLSRMRSLLSAFTHVTTNWLGSHVPYAAYSGCSVSVFGPRPRYSREDYRDDPYYQANPHILGWLFDLIEGGHFEREYGEFFRSPDTGADDRAWAGVQLGEENKRPAVEVARLLHWKASEEVSGRVEDFARWAPELGWMSALESDVPALARQVAELEAKVGTLEQQNVRMTAQVARLQSAGERQAERLKSKEQALSGRTRKIAALRTLLKQRDRRAG